MSDKLTDGSLIQPADGSLIQPADGSLIQPADGSLIQQADGSFIQQADGSIQQADGSIQQADGSIQQADGSIQQADGSIQQADGSSGQLADEAIRQKLRNETASIHWKELQRFFARGLVLWLNNDYDLIDVAVYLAQDKAMQIKPLLAAGHLAKPSNEQAQGWYDLDVKLLSVVIAPFVLVQESSHDREAKR